MLELHCSLFNEANITLLGWCNLAIWEHIDVTVHADITNLVSLRWVSFNAELILITYN